MIHKVKSGETLGSIAKKHHTSVANIKRWNGLKSDNIRVGQRLYIYGSAPKASGSSSSTQKSSGSTQKSSSSSGSTEGASYYIVKSGDTLGGIAKKTGVSLNTLYKLNNMNAKTKIYPGMKIRTK